MNVSNRGYLYFVRLSGKIILLFCVFSYVYQIHYKIFPVTFSVILGLFGILYNFFINRGLFKIKWCNFYVFCGFYLVIISLIISAVVNGTNDYTFLQFGIVNLLNVYSFYTISILFKILYKEMCIRDRYKASRWSKLYPSWNLRMISSLNPRSAK